MNRGLMLTVALIALAGAGWTGRGAGAVKSGNRLYREGKYAEAGERYRELLDGEPESEEVRSVLQFNLGAAAYGQGAYEGAADAFEEALSSIDADLGVGARYNMGNTRFRQGEEKEEEDPDAALELYREALDYYRRAIDMDRDDEDAKFNYEFVQRRIEELESRMKDEQQQEEESGEDGDEEQDGGEGEGEGEGEEGSDGEEEKDPGQQDGDVEGEREEGSADGGQEQMVEMTAEEAQRLIESLEDEEAKSLGRRVRGAAEDGYKDW